MRAVFRWVGGAFVLIFAPSVGVAQQSATIPLHAFVKTERQSVDYNPFYYVNVAIGAPHATVNSVLVDTGSTGLYILQENLTPGSYSLTSTSFTYGYSSGNQISGNVGYATVYFPGTKGANGQDITLATATPIAFGVITQFGCNAANPECNGYRAITKETNPNNYGWNVDQTGVMGVAYSGGQAIFNPLAQLAGGYSNGFIFQANQATGTTTPALVVGLTAENTAGYVFADFASDGATGGNIWLKAWNTKSIVTCFTTAGSTGCLQSIFDSGAGNASFETQSSGGPNSSVNQSVYTPVTIGVDGVMSFSSDLGNYEYEPQHGGTLGYNTGNEIFLYYTVAYDYVNGRIGFLPVGSIAAGYTAFTNDSQLGLPGAGVIVLGTMELGPDFISSRAINLAQSSYLELGAPQIAVNGSVTLNGSLSSTNGGSVYFTGVPGQSNTLTLNGASLFSSTLPIYVKDVTLLANGILPGALNIERGAVLGGSGLIIGSVDAGSGGALAPGNSIGTLSVAGNVRLRADSTYSAEIGAPGVSDQLLVLGAVQLEGGALELIAYPGTSPTLGSYTLIAATGGVTGSFGSLTGTSFGTVGADLPFLAPSLVYTASGITLDMQRSAVSYATAARTPNQFAVARAADTLSSASAVNISLSGLNELTAPAALDNLSGAIHASVQAGLQQQSLFLRDAATGRVRQAQSDRPDASATQAVDLIPGSAATLWAQAYSSWSRIEGDGNAGALSGTLDGFMIGVDRPVGDIWRIGMLGGYSQSDFGVDAPYSSASVDSYDLGLYGGARFGDLGLRLGAGYTWRDLSTSRAVVFGTLAESLSADYRGETAQFFGEIGYDVQTALATFQPFAGLAYVHQSTDGFTETGGTAALSGAGESFDTTYSVLGLRLGHALPLQDGEALMLTASVGWQHAFGDVTPVQTLMLAGATPFTVAGVPIAQDAALVDVGVAYNPTPDVNLGIHYVGQLASSAQDNAIKGTLSVRF